MKGQVGFLGTGIMGGHMARNIAKSGYEVVVWNRTASKAEALAGDGVAVASGPEQAAAGAQFVVLMLSDGPVCNEVLQGGVYQAMDANAHLIVMSSIDVDSAKKQAAECASRQLRYVDAPVSGGEIGAKEARLVIMAGGEQDDFDAAIGLLECMGSAVRVGQAGSGQLAKLTNQVIVALTIMSVAEAFVMAEAGGADLGKLREALLGGFADSTIMRLHGERMIKRDFKPGGPSKHQLKDLRGALQLATQLGLDMPQLKHAEEMFAEFVENGGADVDHSGIIELLRQKVKPL